MNKIIVWKNKNKNIIKKVKPCVSTIGDDTSLARWHTWLRHVSWMGDNLQMVIISTNMVNPGNGFIWFAETHLLWRHTTCRDYQDNIHVSNNPHKWLKNSTGQLISAYKLSRYVNQVHIISRHCLYLHQTSYLY